MRLGASSILDCCCLILVFLTLVCFFFFCLACLFFMHFRRAMLRIRRQKFNSLRVYLFTCCLFPSGNRDWAEKGLGREAVGHWANKSLGLKCADIQIGKYVTCVNGTAFSFSLLYRRTILYVSLCNILYKSNAS